MDHIRVRGAFTEFHRVCKELETHLPKVRTMLQELKDSNKRDMLILCYDRSFSEKKRKEIFNRIVDNQQQIKKLLDQLYILESLEGFPDAHSHLMDEIGIIVSGIKKREEDVRNTRKKEEEMAARYIEEANN